MEKKLDFQEDVLRHCAGRLTPHDAELLFKTASEINPKNILEIGSMDGCSSMILASIVSETNGLVQCIEPRPKQRWRHNMERLHLQKWAVLHIGMSPWVTVERIFHLCKQPVVNESSPIEYLFIDGDHRTRWAIVDYHFWMPFVPIGGRIAFHDWSDPTETGKWVREAVEIILRDDDQYLKLIGETQNKRGLIVYEKTGDHQRYK